VLSRTYRLLGIGPTLNGRNGEGDRYFTDGEVVVGVIASERAAPLTGPHAPPEATENTKDLI
jgi:hypothetical protein